MGKSMNAINQITGILKAMGANPETITKSNGETIIKVNAPTIKAGDQKKCK
jgi:hypothetical protein